MSVSEIEEGKTYWYRDGLFCYRVTAVWICHSVMMDEKDEKKELCLVQTSRIGRDKQILPYSRACDTPGRGLSFYGHELFDDKASANKAWAADLRRQADAIESM